MKLLCHLFGHKTMVKAFTGNVLKVTEEGNMYPSDMALYKWQRERYCIRCGHDVWPPEPPCAKP